MMVEPPVTEECYCRQLGPLSLRAGDVCRACERRLAKLDPGRSHYAGHGGQGCINCGSFDLEPQGMGCEIWRYTCRTCKADPA